MATVEKVESQELRETTNGVTLNRVFSSTWDDYNTGSVLPSGFNGVYDPTNPFPFRVGDALVYDTLSFPIITDRTLNLRITEITIRPVNNVDIIAEIFYSTVFDRVSEREEPDTNASWEESFDMGSFITSDNLYYEDKREVVQGITNALIPYWKRVSTNGFQQRSWVTDWDDEGFPEEDRPAHELHNPTWIWTVRAYSSTMRYESISDFLLSVNSNRWLHDYFMNTANRNGYYATSPAPTIHQTDDGVLGGLDDTGRWLFAECPIRRVRFNSWEYNFVFKFNMRWGWNLPYNIVQDKYPERDFNLIFQGMTNAPKSQNQGVTRS